VVAAAMGVVSLAVTRHRLGERYGHPKRVG
jgi:hypothetical protein